MKTPEQCKLIEETFHQQHLAFLLLLMMNMMTIIFFVEWLNEGSALELFSVRIFTDGFHYRKHDTPKARFGRFTVVMQTSFLTPSRHLFVQSQK